MEGLPITWLALAAVFVIGVVKLLSVGRRPKDYPPGPPTVPVLGNIHQVCSETPLLGCISKGNLLTL